MTLGEQLAEVQSALSAARRAVTSKIGDKEIQRSYALLLQEQRELLKKIDTFGANHTEGLSTTPKKAFAGVSFG